jgi:hypothetical protein
MTDKKFDGGGPTTEADMRFYVMRIRDWCGKRVNDGGECDCFLYDRTRKGCGICDMFPHEWQLPEARTE